MNIKGMRGVESSRVLNRILFLSYFMFLLLFALINPVLVLSTNDSKLVDDSLVKNSSKTVLVSEGPSSEPSSSLGVDSIVESVESGPNYLDLAEYSFIVKPGFVVVRLHYILSRRSLLRLILDLPDDAFDVKIWFDNITGSPSFLDEEARKVSVNRYLSNFVLEYSSRELLRGRFFVGGVKVPFNTTRLRINVKLSPDFVLEVPVKKGDFESASIYPVPKRIESDGQSLIFVWEFNNTKSGFSLPIIMILKKRMSSFVYLSLLGLSLVLVILAVIVYSRRKPVIKKVIVRKIDKITKHLKEDEEQILNILKQRGGSCEQGTLTVITGMSKSNLSRILKELEERRLIKKVKKGKKNIIFKI